MKVSGNKSIYGASVGILMLNARFPRIPGDMGNALSWPFPVHYKIVEEASPDRVVRQNAAGLLDRFIEAGQELIDRGADGITTNCGFLALFQKELSQALRVPVATSSLMQVPFVDSLLPEGKRAGILTISADTLTPAHLEGAGVKIDTPVFGTQNGKEFTRAILNNEGTLDIELARQDNVDAALAFLKQHPEIGALVLECTNMVPYAADIRAATGVPVYSIHSFVCWFQSGLMPPQFPGTLADARPIRY